MSISARDGQPLLPRAGPMKMGQRTMRGFVRVTAEGRARIPRTGTLWDTRRKCATRYVARAIKALERHLPSSEESAWEELKSLRTR